MKELTLGDFQRVLKYLIDNNRQLVDSGDTPISVCLEGEAGLGKTQTVQQVAESKGMSFVKVNLAQLEEPAELIGFPYKEYEITRTKRVPAEGFNPKIEEMEPQLKEIIEKEWVASDLLKDLNCDFNFTNQSRMSYAIPAWVPRDENPNGTILLLDDFSRANNLIIQAVMEIINTGSYISWNLPKYTNIVLTSNPDNGNYTVTGLDSAVKSRMITFCGKFDIQEWAKWAENFGIDGRAINFAMLYSSEIFEPKNNVTLANARNYTTFCRAISGIEDWETPDSLGLILEIASGCFLEKDNVLGGLFTQFVSNKLDKLISPDRMINDAWESVNAELLSCVGEGANYRADIASILGTRLLNYSDKYLGTAKAESMKVCGRLVAMLDAEPQLMTQDILYHILKTLCNNHKAATNRWLMNSRIRSIAL